MVSTFLVGLRPQTLESFEVISHADIGHESLQALSTHHQESLKELKLSGLHLTALPSLKNCVALESFHLDGGSADYSLGGAVILDIVDWLRNCKKLQNISLVRMFHSPEIIKPVLLENDIRLLKLEVEGYMTVNNREFHQALTNQTSLQSLKLKGDIDGTSVTDTEFFVDCLAKLTNLRDLQLRDVSDFFDDANICDLVRDLSELQVFWTSGFNISDAVLPALTRLKLRSLSFGALTVFTKDSILRYISSLDPEQNKGLSFAVLNADPGYNLTEADQAQIRLSISQKVGGGFEFFLNRGPCPGVFSYSVLIPSADYDSSDGSDSESG
ncbi:hypothetical protein FGG08_003406 [Glutinoglossum americanum]|uniref:Uncharacterized protein n=1 Tax=Glutinoglossum americanum TaxID=1670608 RepID=A0A9P8L4T0_9PEZI|nr:hypothetical protein FGG08_003406 [Glutinoglossum americanum]